MRQRQAERQVDAFGRQSTDELQETRRASTAGEICWVTRLTAAKSLFATVRRHSSEIGSGSPERTSHCRVTTPEQPRASALHPRGDAKKCRARRGIFVGYNRKVHPPAELCPPRTPRGLTLCGEPLSLRPLTQAQMSGHLRAQPGLSVVADAGRISRLVRGLSIALANGKTIPLVKLFPRPRQIHCYFIDCVVKSEKAWLLVVYACNESQNLLRRFRGAEQEPLSAVALHLP